MVPLEDKKQDFEDLSPHGQLSASKAVLKSESDTSRTLPERSREQTLVDLDIVLFDPVVLRDEVALENAMGILEGHLRHPAAERDYIFLTLLSRDHLFEFVFSSLQPDTALLLQKWILQDFPTAAAHFDGSFAARILSRLSFYFWSLSYPTPDLRDYHRAFELAAPVLKAIRSLPFVTQSPVDGIETEDFGFFIAKPKTQREKKKAKRAPRAPRVDSKPFKNFGVDVPQSEEEAQTLAMEILQNQQKILESYLDVLRKTELVEIFKSAYLPQNTITIEASAEVAHDDGNVSFQSSEHEEENVPSAYPMVQPMKAALYFDSVDGFGEWRILISTRADRNLREAKRSDQNLFRIIIKKIKELSCGHFSDDNQKRLTGSDIDIPIYEAKMTRDTRLVYQIDCIKEFESDVEWQAIRIFGIYTHAQLDRRFWEAVGMQLAGKGKEYRKRCIFRNPSYHPGDNVVAPASFPAQEEAPLPPACLEIPDLRNEDREELHSLLVLEKFVAFSQALLNSILADQDVAHVFQMTPQEQEIVKHSGSCYVLGRSGTGKTTTMLFKMLGIERTWDGMRETMLQGYPKPRQIFVTQSRVLAEKVEEYYAKLSESHAAAQRTVEQSVQMAEAKQAVEEQGLVDRDEEQFHSGDLPKSYGELTDEHFPLFITFDHLSRLLEADFASGKYGENSQLLVMAKTTYEGQNLSNDYMQQQRASFVSYGAFLQEYWPHFRQNLTKNLDPALVFAEFMGVIKGSEQALQSSERFLDRDTYLDLSHRTQGTFANQRETVYALFQAYSRRKKIRGDYDAADRTHAILRALREYGVPGSKIDFIYVDEAQDNLLIDALIPRTLCRNPDGLFWAGDTAQTISAGSSFRFNDLKAFLYRVEETRSISNLQESPKSFQLTVNYRSHGGIVSCAQTVVRLITQFWPHAIDILADERGVIDGIKPVFFNGWDHDTMRYEQFLFSASGGHMEFGAQQCILVRDDAARDKLREQVGDIGLIMTLYESKGLEFNDVLLYNFFEDSTVDLSQWRVILNALPDVNHSKCPQFDDTRHSGVCRELKFLYVAITRARKNLWIADCSEKGDPMRELWLHKDQIQMRKPGDVLPQLATSSTAEEWAKTARALFDNRRYTQAIHCYERAGMYRERNIAQAYHLRERARAVSLLDSTRPSAFTTAARAFAHAAVASGTRPETRAYYRIAAECFSEAGDYRRAAQSYFSAEEFTRSAQCYRKANMFDKAVEVIKSHRDKIKQDDAEAILSIAKLYYFREHRLEKATQLFANFEEALEYMEDYGFDIVRADLLEQVGRVVEAAELHRAEGRDIKAITLLLQNRNDPRASSLATEWILQGLWKCLPFDVTMNMLRDTSKPIIASLLDLANQVMETENLSAHIEMQILMFKAIASHNFLSLQQLGVKLYTELKNPLASVLCLDHVFRNMPKFQTQTCSEIAEILQAFLIYCQELHKITTNFEACNDAGIQRLFGFQIALDHIVTIPEPTFMYGVASRSRAAKSVEEAFVTMEAGVFMRLFQQTLRQRLQIRVQTEDLTLWKSPLLRPCLAFAVFGECMSYDCPNAHTERQSLDVEWYNARLRLIFQQVLIYHTVRSVEKRSVYAGQQRFWLTLLFQALYPPHYILGSLANLDKLRIPEFERGIQVVNNWIQDLFFTLSAQENPQRFLTTVIQAASIAFVFQKPSAQEFLKRAPCVVNPPESLKRDHERFVLHDLLEALDGSQVWSISAGTLGLRHICSTNQALDINTLCQLIDWICGSTVIAHRMRRNSNLHDTTLPRSWLLTLSSDPNIALQEPSWVLTGSFIRSVGDVLEALSSGVAADHLFLEERQLYKSTRVRNVYINRICRTLALLGYNIPSPTLRRDIVQTLNSLRKPGRSIPALYSGYINSGPWPDVARALRRTDGRPDPLLDELTELKEETKLTGPVRTWRGIRTLVFRTPPGAIATVRSRGQSTLRADAAPFIPRHLELNVAADDNMEDSSLAEEDFDVAEPVASADSVHIENAFQPLAPPTESEIQAAIRIQRKYRRYCARRDSPSTLSEAWTRWYEGCLKTSNGLRVAYKVRFLGFLPHVLVCLEKLNRLAFKAKKQAAKKWSAGNNDDLEKVNEELDRTSQLAKEVLRLQKTLTPTSAIHGQQRIEILRAHVIEVVELSQRFPASTANDWERDLQIAVIGIVGKREPHKKRLKPKLVVEDAYDII
ncbi:unnamed protein product [Somion occarium]|uniref:UvrD-like helicase ATP-binding domain-containing protein n=1 Tax=Somion occarium TaxID=3059160 RepID=A0ABP1CRM9_9APHY